MEMQESGVTPSTLQLKLSTPETESDIVLFNKTELVYQPFDPLVPLKESMIEGGSESTLMLRLPISDVSVKEECAQ
jgi:hypothetical protein